MQTIKTSFTKYGHRFQLITRSGDVALFERTFEGKNICYELIIIRRKKQRVMPSGKVRPASEEYPSTNDFGTLGWSLIKHTEEKALARFRSLVAKRKQQADAIIPDHESLYSN